MFPACEHVEHGCFHRLQGRGSTENKLPPLSAPHKRALGFHVRRLQANENDIDLYRIHFPDASQPCFNGNCAKFTMVFVIFLFLRIVQGVSSQSSMCVLLCRYFLLDPDLGQLHYFVNEQGKSQKPRGSLPLIGASVTQSDEAPHMFIVHSVTGELYKLRGETCRLHSSAARWRGVLKE